MPEQLEGVVPSKDFNQQLVRLVERFNREKKGSVNRQRTNSPTPGRFLAVITDAELGGASLLSPSSGLATVCDWNGTAYAQTENQVTVYNHSGEDIAEDTPGAAIDIDGHLWLFADCDPLSSRPTPPWDE